MDASGAEVYDEDASDQPVDYSRKYVERNALSQTARLVTCDGSRVSRAATSKKEFRGRDAKVDLFYAETDLDQPTDYSLRYAEDDTDDESKQSTEYFHGSEQEDTVKTYCTEGTPYETPFNFSTATSMSDLRVEDTKENESLKKGPLKEALEINRKRPESFIDQNTTTLDRNEQDDGLATKEEELDESSKDSAVLNPGQVTPEKIVSYYEDGTSHGFSRVNSPSSLNDAVIAPNNDISEVMSKVDLPNVPDKEDLENNDSHDVLRLSGNQAELSSESSDLSANKNNPRILDKEGKMVTFGGQDYYAEETPLMFSRCSSLGSLSGFEQHSIHDDRSSVVSDFSRRTSGAVSPSELPDSPTQTVLPSPRNHKTQNAEFISKMQEEAVRPSVRHLSYSKPQDMSSVFEDEIATFKEESTPIEFSTATSLSSLTIDDEIKIPSDSKTHHRLGKASITDEKDVHELETDMLKMTISDFDGKVKEEQVSDGDEDDEDMLTACINMGMQTNRYRQSLKTLSSQKSMQSESSGMPYQQNSVPSRLVSHASVVSVEKSIGITKANKTVMEMVVAPDTMHVYCTEDTPADISPVGSHSNLSVLSMPSVQEDIEKIEHDKSAEIECRRNDLSDESSNLSGEDEKILDECIQSGMPKARPITPLSTNSISYVKKSETSPHKFNVCGTPSSSPVEISHANKDPIMEKSMSSVGHLSELFDDSPNHSDDEAILTECIQSAMPKARFSVPTSIKSSLPQTVENPKFMNMQAPPTSTFFQSRYVEQKKNATKKLLPYEENTGLSEEEEDIILAQCIRSGMPKVLNSTLTIPSSAVKKFQLCSKVLGNFSVCTSPSYLASKATVKSIAPRSPSYRANVDTTENRCYIGNATPSNCNCNYNNNSGKTANDIQQGQTIRSCDNGTYEKINSLPHCARRSSEHHAESENGNFIDNLCVSTQSRIIYGAPLLDRTENYDDSCRNVMKSNPVPSRHSSVSSLNEEGLLISKEEWALQELCINSDTTRNEYPVKGIKTSEDAISGGHDECESISEDNYSVCSYNSYVCKT